MVRGELHYVECLGKRVHPQTQEHLLGSEGHLVTKLRLLNIIRG